VGPSHIPARRKRLIPNLADFTANFSCEGDNGDL
jgi:hypothetical protein